MCAVLSDTTKHGHDSGANRRRPAWHLPAGADLDVRHVRLHHSQPVLANQVGHQRNPLCVCSHLQGSDRAGERA